MTQGIAMRSASWTSLFMVITACSDGGIECPNGMVQQGSTCVPVEDLVGHDGVVLPDIELVKDVADIEEEEILHDMTTVDFKEDIPPKDNWPGGFIGMGCNSSSDCIFGGVKGECLNWVKGYCSIMDCDKGDTSCPEGAVCMTMTPKQTACAMQCKSDADCRVNDGYACKTLLDHEGKQVQVCWQVKKTNGPGEGCSGPQDCAGAATCLTNFAGGYCAVQYCEQDASCPTDTHCVNLNKVPTCMKACSSDDACAVAQELPRKCIELTSIETGEKVGVCGSGTLGVPIGGQCRNDSECASFDCHIAAIGTCSGTSSLGCVTNQDCPSTEICVPSPESTFGYCTAKCSGPCSGMSYCIGGPESGQGECLPGCTGKGDPTCRAEAGLSCIYGAPIGYPPGRYACARLAPGAMGTTCKDTSECKSGQCLTAPGGYGYCTGACMLGYCPFPTYCQQVAGQSRCLLLCLSSQDCPEGHECGMPAGASVPVCYPP